MLALFAPALRPLSADTFNVLLNNLGGGVVVRKDFPYLTQRLGVEGVGDAQALAAGCVIHDAVLQ